MSVIHLDFFLSLFLPALSFRVLPEYFQFPSTVLVLSQSGLDGAYLVYARVGSWTRQAGALRAERARRYVGAGEGLEGKSDQRPFAMMSKQAPATRFSSSLL